VRPAGGIGTPGAASLPREGCGRSARFFISSRLPTDRRSGRERRKLGTLRRAISSLIFKSV
jgi:hypothetical protein